VDLFEEKNNCGQGGGGEIKKYKYEKMGQSELQIKLGDRTEYTRR